VKFYWPEFEILEVIGNPEYFGFFCCLDFSSLGQIPATLASDSA